MNIEINGKNYTVRETDAKWVIKVEMGKLTTSYEVSKKDCATPDELRQFLTDKDIF